jgi:hypothetical protein
MGIDVQQTFKQLDLSPINVLQTDRNMGLLSQENMFLTLYHYTTRFSEIKIFQVFDVFLHKTVILSRIWISRDQSAPSCVSAPRIGFVSPVPH